MKTCRSCLQEKDGEAFHSYPRNRDGLQSYCKACQTEKRKAKYHANPTPHREEAIKRYKQRLASGSIDTQAKSLYDKNYRATNVARLAEVKAAWREANADLIRIIRTSYKAKRRAIEKAGDPTAKIRTWLASQPRICAWCRADCSSRFHLDHIHPLSRGGRHVVDNLCVACPTCNVRKNAKTVDAWRQEIGMLEPA
jgi:5-methylcytosine-specific restriction endonuclease McrA